MTLNDIKARTEEVVDCWIWQKTLLRGKTPIMKIAGQSVYPRRVVWELQHGKPIPEAAVVAAYGGRIEFLPLLPAHSTSDLVQRIRERG